MTTAAVLPIKQLHNAKQRLADLLSADERALLCKAMLEDVLTAVEACTAIDRILVVTDDEDVTALAGAFGAEIRAEPDSPGLIEAVTEAGLALAGEGADAMVFLPGDVPLVSPEELDVVTTGITQKGGASFLIVPAEDLGGSNCVVCSPPDCMTFAFGIDSFRKHLDIARQRDMEPQVARLPGLGLDIDTPDDLRTLIERVGEDVRGGQEYSTVRFLQSNGIAERLEGQTAGIG